jgi:hypothetical protein
MIWFFMLRLIALFLKGALFVFFFLPIKTIGKLFEVLGKRKASPWNTPPNSGYMQKGARKKKKFKEYFITKNNKPTLLLQFFVFSPLFVYILIINLESIIDFLRIIPRLWLFPLLLAWLLGGLLPLGLR